MPPSTSILTRLKELAQEFRLRNIQTEAYNAATKDMGTNQPTFREWFDSLAQPMKQAVYRGYAGDNSAMASQGPLFVATQKPMAEVFANRRASQLGSEPRLEMFMMDPENYLSQYRIHPSEAENMSKVMKVDPTALSGRTQLYANGGLAHFKGCSCGQ